MAWSILGIAKELSVKRTVAHKNAAVKRLPMTVRREFAAALTDRINNDADGRLR